MKKTLIGMLAVALTALMITNAYAQCACVPPPCFPPCRPPGFTPGFWKHNIRVYLGLTNGKYSAFEGGRLDGVKLTDTMMKRLLAAINTELTDWGYPTITFRQALYYLKLKGWDTRRTYTANWFNWAAGYGAY